MKYTYDWDLYGWGDRAYEGCIAHVTVEAPETWALKIPEPEEISLVDIELSEETRTWLESVFRTDVPKLIADLKGDWGKHNKEDVYDAMADAVVEERGLGYLDEWE